MWSLLNVRVHRQLLGVLECLVGQMVLLLLGHLVRLVVLLVLGVREGPVTLGDVIHQLSDVIYVRRVLVLLLVLVVLEHLERQCRPKQVYSIAHISV